jgi:hypothetical protein
MTFRKPILLVAPLLLIACGASDQVPLAKESDGPGYNELASRVSAITGKPVPQAEAEAPTSEHALVTASDGLAPAVDGLHRYTVLSAQYKVPSSYIQLPAHWKVEGLETGYWSATAPGMRVHQTPPTLFKDVTGELRQMYLSMGQSLRPPLRIEQVFAQDLAPKMQAEGYELVEQKSMPELARKATADINMLYMTGNVRPTLQSLVGVWKKGDQRRALFLNWIRMDSDGLVVWGYGTTTLDAPASSFEAEKNSLIQASLTAQAAPEGIAAQHRDARMKEQQSRMQAQQQQVQNQQSWAAHNQRMQSNQAAFHAQQAAHTDMVNSVNNSIMGGYNSTMGSMDRMQNATINGIRGEQDAYNPYTGDAGKIQSGYDNYWMNSDGQYIGTNDGTYDPNVNGQWTDQWREVPTEP